MPQVWDTFLTSQGLSIDRERFGNQSTELSMARDKAVMCPLTDQGIIRVAGEDSATFLHNLLSNDIIGISQDNARFAGLCTPKGRLLALLLIWREGQDFLLMLPLDILQSIQKRLSMYVLRSKVKITDATENRIAIGLSVPPTSEQIDHPAFTMATLLRFGVQTESNFQLIQLDATRRLLICDPANGTQLWHDLIGHANPVGLGAWQWLEIAAGQPRVVMATQDAFVPQMLNMELPSVAGVSFTKGCYPGQEIVARTQYLGKIKRRMYRVKIADEATKPVVGAPIFSNDSGDQSCGTLISVAPSPAGGFEALACAQSAIVESAEVRLGSLEGLRIEFLKLPYELS